MQARSLMTSALPKLGTVRSTLRLPSSEGVVARLSEMNHRSALLEQRMTRAREENTHRFDHVSRGRRW